MYTGGEVFDVEIEPTGLDKELDSLASSSSAATGEIKGPIPGVVSQIYVKEGDSVKKNDKLLSFLAMKMQNEVKSPIEGTVKKIFVKPNASFNKGDKLLLIE